MCLQVLWGPQQGKRRKKRRIQGHKIQQKRKTKSARPSTKMNPPPELEENEEESKEEVATQLGCAKPLTGHFTIACNT